MDFYWGLKLLILDLVTLKIENLYNWKKLAKGQKQKI